MKHNIQYCQQCGTHFDKYVHGVHGCSNCPGHNTFLRETNTQLALELEAAKRTNGTMFTELLDANQKNVERTREVERLQAEIESLRKALPKDAHRWNPCTAAEARELHAGGNMVMHTTWEGYLYLSKSYTSEGRPMGPDNARAKMSTLSLRPAASDGWLWCKP